MKEIQVGQQIVISDSDGWYSRPYKIETVIKVLKNQIELSNGEKYSLKTLKELSEYSSKRLALDYTSRELVSVQEAERRNEILAKEKKIKKTANQISNFDWKQVSLEEIELVEQIMERYIENKK